MSGEKSAVVFSAGGMFGAWQAGVWDAIGDTVRPDMVAGASIGAVNAWMVAARVPAAEIIDRWDNLEFAARLRLKLPATVLDGFIDSGALTDRIRELHDTHRPRMPVGVVLTDLLRLRPEVVVGEEITWRHLAASCAVLGVYPQQRIGGRVYTDGGLLGALPIWAAVKMGASRVIAVHALPVLPSRVMRMAVRLIKTLSGFRPGPPPPGVQLTVLTPDGPLGSLRDAVVWKRDNVRRWIEAGRRRGETFASGNV